MVPPLNEQEYEELKGAIRESGAVLVPIVVADDGEVIDGQGRVRAATELGLKDYPREVVGGLDAEARRLLRVTLNCARRHMPLCQKREVARATLRAAPAMNDAWVAAVTGLDGKTVRRVREESEATSEIPTLTEFRRRDGRVQPRRVYARTERERREAADALAVLEEDVPRRAMTAREARRAASRRTARPASAVQVAVLHDDEGAVQVHHCDFRAWQVAPGSSRLVFTDPLYHEQHLPLYSALGEWAARVLEPGGLLVAYLGTSFVPEVIRRLGEHLEYVWMCHTTFAGEKTSVHSRKVR
jgi:ParB-like chromosome segregation protein Spo0J